MDTVYVDNAAHAHLLAAQRLAPTSPVAGKAYFISNGEPLPLWEMVNRILAAAGLPPVTATISPAAAYAVGTICEGIWSLFRLAGEPPMTRFVARELSTSHWFDIGGPPHLGNEPENPIDEGCDGCGPGWRKPVPGKAGFLVAKQGADAYNSPFDTSGMVCLLPLKA